MCSSRLWDMCAIPASLLHVLIYLFYVPNHTHTNKLKVPSFCFNQKLCSFNQIVYESVNVARTKFWYDENSIVLLPFALYVRITRCFAFACVSWLTKVLFFASCCSCFFTFRVQRILALQRVIRTSSHRHCVRHIRQIATLPSKVKSMKRFNYNNSITNSSISNNPIINRCHINTHRCRVSIKWINYIMRSCETTYNTKRLVVVQFSLKTSLLPLVSCVNWVHVRPRQRRQHQPQIPWPSMMTQVKIVRWVQLAMCWCLTTTTFVSKLNGTIFVSI